MTDKAFKNSDRCFFAKTMSAAHNLVLSLLRSSSSKEQHFAGESSNALLLNFYLKQKKANKQNEIKYPLIEQKINSIMAFPRNI